MFQLTPAGVLTDLYSFCSQTNCTDGDRPYGGLARGAVGNFYGSTYEGGGSADCPAGCGTIFQITPGGTLTTLYRFSATDGAYPYGNLLLASDGNFYGATAEVSDFGPVGNGTIFKITSGGTLTTLHTFSGTDGSYPYGPLVRAPNGTFYGTTNEGGSGTNCADNCGTVFAITPAGVLTTLHNFAGTDGCYPYGGMTLVGTVLYGTASQCGTNNVGTVFKITTTGALSTLHNFSGPDGSLIQATNGKLYGTTEEGGSDPSCFQPTNCSGTVFQITPAGALTTLHAFNGTDGSTLFGGVAEATNGIFYGTTNRSAFSLGIGLAPFVETVPASGPEGATVNILGTNLAGVTGVSFGAAAATFTIVSPTLITATVPDGATTTKIGVTTPGQSSAISGCAWVGGTATCILASTSGFEIGYPLATRRGYSSEVQHRQDHDHRDLRRPDQLCPNCEPRRVQVGRNSLGAQYDAV